MTWEPEELITGEWRHLGKRAGRGKLGDEQQRRKYKQKENPETNKQEKKKSYSKEIILKLKK